MTQPNIVPTTTDELKAKLAAAGVEAQAQPVADPDDIETTIPQGQHGLGVLTEGVWPAEVGKLELGTSKAGNPTVTFPILVVDGPYKGEEGKIIAALPIAAQYHAACSIPFHYNPQTRQLKFKSTAWQGVPVKVKWEKTDQGYIRPNGIFPMSYEPKQVEGKA